MTQVKFFEGINTSNVEREINEFLQKNANIIKVIDIKHTTAVITHANFCTWTAMIIYETL